MDQIFRFFNSHVLTFTSMSIPCENEKLKTGLEVETKNVDIQIS